MPGYKMKRSMWVNVSKYREDNDEAFRQAAESVWSFSEWCNGYGMMQSFAFGFLCEGESESHCAERLAVAIWKANGAYCNVIVVTTCLENATCGEFCPTETDYARLIERQYGREHGAGNSGECECIGHDTVHCE